MAVVERQDCCSWTYVGFAAVCWRSSRCDDHCRAIGCLRTVYDDSALLRWRILGNGTSDRSSSQTLSRTVNVKQSQSNHKSLTYAADSQLHHPLNRQLNHTPMALRDDLDLKRPTNLHSPHAPERLVVESGHPQINPMSLLGLLNTAVASWFTSSRLALWVSQPGVAWPGEMRICYLVVQGRKMIGVAVVAIVGDDPLVVWTMVVGGRHRRDQIRAIWIRFWIHVLRHCLLCGGHCCEVDGSGANALIELYCVGGSLGNTSSSKHRVVGHPI